MSKAPARDWIAEAQALKLACASPGAARNAVKANERATARKTRRQRAHQTIEAKDFGRCKYCGRPGLLWVNTQKNAQARQEWRLLGPDAKQHTCAESKANAALKAKIRQAKSSATLD